MTHKRALHREKQILKTCLTPTLEQAGFKQRGNIYERASGRLHYLLDVQRDYYNTVEKSEFALNCGIFVDGLWSTYTGLPEPKAPDTPGGAVHTRPGLLTSPKRTQWWQVKLSDGPERDAEIGQEIRSLVEDAVLPFFERFPDEAAIAEFLSQPRKKEDQQIFPHAESLQRTYAAILWRMLGCRAKCQECLEQAIALRKAPGREVFDAFMKRFSCSDLPPGSGS
jgi:hypothetical protein